MKELVFAGAFLILGSISIGAQASLNDSSPKNRKLVESIATLGRAYTDMIRRNDAASIASIVADDYLVADEVGKVYTKQEDLATYVDRAKSVKIDTVEYKDQKVRILNDEVAIDHATIRFRGTRSGKPFDITERCTTIWALRKGRWLIVADHFSYLKP
ncbi:MAG: nuclear transport factor 2 family protein [Saprospiraceae bacterium]|nr:nuclear transport factor 2 family protein [Pyrinomonadaceae bacterium]